MLSNVEREKLVLDLYYSQGKNVRQIAQGDHFEILLPF